MRSNTKINATRSFLVEEMEKEFHYATYQHGASESAMKQRMAKRHTTITSQLKCGGIDLSLFQCEKCGCIENTACSAQGFHLWPHLFDWSYDESLRGLQICSACGPSKYNDGKPTEYGKWHNRFKRRYLPIGEFQTNRYGDLEKTSNGDTDVIKYEVSNA